MSVLLPSGIAFSDCSFGKALTYVSILDVMKFIPQLDTKGWN